MPTHFKEIVGDAGIVLQTFHCAHHVTGNGERQYHNSLGKHELPPVTEGSLSIGARYRTSGNLIIKINK